MDNMCVSEDVRSGVNGQHVCQWGREEWRDWTT